MNIDSAKERFDSLHQELVQNAIPLETEQDARLHIIRGSLKSQEGSQGDNLSMKNLRQHLESHDKSIR